MPGKRLDFGQVKSPAVTVNPPTPAKPKSIDFSAVPSPPVHSAPPTQSPTKVKRLDFGSVPSAPKKSPPAAPTNPKPIFEIIGKDAIDAATTSVAAKYADLDKQHHLTIVRQLSELIPVKITTIMSWASNTLQGVADTATKSATLVRQFSEARGNELLEKTLTAIKAPPSMMTKVFGKLSAHDPISAKPQLAVLKSQLEMQLPTCSDLITQTKDLHVKLMIKMVTLAAVADVADVAGPHDQLVDDSITQRRTLIQHGVLQSELLTKQLIEIQTQIVDQIARVDQMLMSTMPAYEMALARS